MPLAFTQEDFLVGCVFPQIKIVNVDDDYSFHGI